MNHENLDALKGLTGFEWSLSESHADELQNMDCGAVLRFDYLHGEQVRQIKVFLEAVGLNHYVFTKMQEMSSAKEIYTLEIYLPEINYHEMIDHGQQAWARFPYRTSLTNVIEAQKPLLAELGEKTLDISAFRLINEQIKKIGMDRYYKYHAFYSNDKKRSESIAKKIADEFNDYIAGKPADDSAGARAYYKGTYNGEGGVVVINSINRNGSQANMEIINNLIAEVEAKFQPYQGISVNYQNHGHSIIEVELPETTVRALAQDNKLMQKFFDLVDSVLRKKRDQQICI